MVKSLNEIAKDHGIDLNKIKDQTAEFDILTGKPFSIDVEGEIDLKKILERVIHLFELEKNDE